MEFPVWSIPRASATGEVFTQRMCLVGDAINKHIEELKNTRPLRETDGELLEYIEKGGKIKIIVDKCGGHSPEAMADFVKAYPVCEFLNHPSSSPDLNPGETKWRLMKQILYTFRRATSANEYHLMVQLASHLANSSPRLNRQILFDFSGASLLNLIFLTI